MKPTVLIIFVCTCIIITSKEGYSKKCTLSPVLPKQVTNCKKTKKKCELESRCFYSSCEGLWLTGPICTYLCWAESGKGDCDKELFPYRWFPTYRLPPLYLCTACPDYKNFSITLK
ncbi:hypothetical protein GKODMF_12680 [Candidatus Electrothrix gigas]